MTYHPFRQKVIDQFILSWRNARPEAGSNAVDYLTDLYDRFYGLGLADRIFEEQLTSGNPSRYAQRMGELLLADLLWKGGFDLISNDEGPDFRATKNGYSTWIELQTPEPMGIPADYYNRSGELTVRSEPFDAISLRWTSAMAEKKNTLDRYLESGVIKADEPYVIAINARLLNHFSMRGLNGASGKPVPVEILFSVGPLQLEIDRHTGAIIDQSHVHRPFLDKPGTENKVPADSFMNPRNKGVSAVLGVDLLEQVALGGSHPSALVYNPYAQNPIGKHWIPAQEHWSCTMGDKSYFVDKA